LLSTTTIVFQFGSASTETAPASTEQAPACRLTACNKSPHRPKVGLVEEVEIKAKPVEELPKEIEQHCTQIVLETALAIFDAHRAVDCLTESATASTTQRNVRIALALACIRPTPVTRALVLATILAWTLQEGNGLDRVVEPPEIGLCHECIPT
jgi:hypothetical protein